MKIHIHRNDTGIFLFFLDFDDEDQFPDFLNFLSAKANVKLGKPLQGPYSISASLEMSGVMGTAMWHDGCAVRFDLKNESIAFHLAESCYGKNWSQ